MKNIITTNLREDGILEIYHGDELMCTVEDGRTNEDFVEDVLYGMGYQWNEDGTLTKLEDAFGEAFIERVDIVKRVLGVEIKDAIKIIEHLTRHDCLFWVDDYDEESNNDEPLVDIHYESTFEDMIDWQYDNARPSEIIRVSADIEDHPEMLELSNKVIFWYGLV